MLSLLLTSAACKITEDALLYCQCSDDGNITRLPLGVQSRSYQRLVLCFNIAGSFYSLCVENTSRSSWWIHHRMNLPRRKLSVSKGTPLTQHNRLRMVTKESSTRAAVLRMSVFISFLKGGRTNHLRMKAYEKFSELGCDHCPRLFNPRRLEYSP